MSNSPNLCSQHFADIHQSGRSIPYHGYINLHPRTHSNIYFRYSYRSNRISSGTAFIKLKVLIKYSLQYIERDTLCSSIKIIFLVLFIQLYGLADLIVQTEQTNLIHSNSGSQLQQNHGNKIHFIH